MEFRSVQAGISLALFFVDSVGTEDKNGSLNGGACTWSSHKKRALKVKLLFINFFFFHHFILLHSMLCRWQPAVNNIACECKRANNLSRKRGFETLLKHHRSNITNQNASLAHASSAFKQMLGKFFLFRKKLFFVFPVGSGKINSIKLSSKASRAKAENWDNE